MKTKYLLVIAFISSNLSAQNGFSNWDCLNSNPEAYAVFTDGGSVFTAQVNAALNELCSDFELEEEESSIEEPDGVFFICNGEFIEIDTLNFNEAELFEYIQSLNCSEIDDWLPEDDLVDQYYESDYWSWDCIYNYPEAATLYSDWGNPEAAAQLQEFCLAVANGEWMWGEDPSGWPITCEVGTSFATVEFETSGIGYEEEISWSLDGYEGGIGLTTVCVNEGCTQFNMYDSWGDGWGGITFTLNTPNGVLLNGTLEDGFVGALGFGINTTEDCSEVSEVENPFGYDLESFEDVFQSIGEINLDSLYPSIEFSENDLLFIIDGSEVDLSLFDENELNIYPQEVNGYLIFGPFDINDVLTIDINDIADLLISWGFFRPMNDEIISQGTFSKDDPNLPSILSLSSESPNSVMDIILSSEDHTTLEAAVVAAGLVQTLSSNGPFTIFAPTDDAFNLLPEGTVESLLADTTGALAALLTSHVSGGSTFSTSLFNGMTINTVAGTELMVSINSNGVYIDNALVTVADLTADNGVVHVINAVLVPEPEVVSNTVVDIIVNSPDHTLLAAAIVSAELAETLSGEGPFTVFAPTDSAFALLPEEVITELLEDPSGDLTTILTHHVHSGNVLSSTLTDGMMVPTLAGTELTISIMDDMVQIDNANVTVADIETDNGVVHVIDAVLLPSTEMSINESIILEDNSKYLYSIDILGKKVDRDSRNMVIFEVYDSGKVLKQFKF